MKRACGELGGRTREARESGGSRVGASGDEEGGEEGKGQLGSALNVAAVELLVGGLGDAEPIDCGDET